jgi:hypothetical protein
MNKVVSTLLLFLLAFGAFAQEETVSPLPYNAALYYQTRPYNNTLHGSHKYLIDRGIYVVQSNTLTLPFIDDFTSNTLRPYKEVEANVTDTFFNVVGTCIVNEGMDTVYTILQNDTSWQYTFDTLNDRVDSVAKPAQPFTFFGLATSGCFDQAPSTVYYWPRYYTYDFDTATGRALDSTLVTDVNTENVFYVPVVYFSTVSNGALWFDNYAYRNSTYPILPPNYGVATLDGLNEYGLPYNNSVANAYGNADKLTSKPLDLSGLSEADSVYLSFFYEGQGLGDNPETSDSLIIELLDNGGIWHRAWSDTGYSVPANAPNSFKQQLVYVGPTGLNTSYFHNKFQFRFRNKATLTGNNDHWHIDYVKLDRNRSAADTIILDRGFVYEFPSITKNYTLMPADQYSGQTDLVDSIVLVVRNLDPNADNNPPATNFLRTADEIYPTPANFYNGGVQTFNASTYKTVEVDPALDYVIPVAPFSADSFIIKSQVFIQANDVRAQNDTVTTYQTFSNILAYDDGSAERAYGLTGLQTKKFGYRFTLNKPDTLVAFQVHFTQINQNVSDLVFNYYLWDTIELGILNYAEPELYQLTNQRPKYIDSVNGFATYVLDTPVIVDNTFFFGWAQTDDRNLQIGLDLNSTRGRPNMFVYRNSLWQASTISTQGSPMIRLIFDTDFYGFNSGIKDVTANNLSIKVYPNPTTGLVTFDIPKEIYKAEVVVYDLTGKLMLKQGLEGSTLSLNGLQEGFYLVQLRDLNSGKTYTNKILKSTN